MDAIQSSKLGRVKINPICNPQSAIPVCVQRIGRRNRFKETFYGHIDNHSRLLRRGLAVCLLGNLQVVAEGGMACRINGRRLPFLPRRDGGSQFPRQGSTGACTLMARDLGALISPPADRTTAKHRNEITPCRRTATKPLSPVFPHNRPK